MSKDIFLVDIDGTISNLQHRLRFITQQDPKDWDSFFDECDMDEPIQDIITLVQDVMRWRKNTLVFVTGRTEAVRDKTWRWINKHLGYAPDEFLLLMRKDGDHRNDDIVKAELLREAGIKAKDVFLALEDRNQVVRMYRDMGITCLQVADGDF